MTDKKKRDIIPIIIEYPEYTISLLHFNDSNNMLKDECGNTWTKSGSPNITTTNAKYGKALNFNKGYLTSSLTFGGRDFTIDFWTRADSSCTTEGAAMVQVYYSDNLRFQVGYHKSYPGCHFFARWASNQSRESEKIIPKSTIVHIAFVYIYDNSKLNCYYNGSLLMSCSMTLISRAYKLFLGRNNSGSGINNLIGQLDEFRIVDGVAVWKEKFTPPTKPYTLS